MRVFMLVSRVPWPLEKGDKLRAYNQLVALAKQHEVHLYCLSDSAVQSDAVAHLKTITPHVTVFRLNPIVIAFRLFWALFSRKPFQVHYFYQWWIAGKIDAAIAKIHPDQIYCQLVRCSEYVKHFHDYTKTLDYMDALSAGQRRRLERAPWFLRPFVKEEAERLRGYEHLIFDYFEHHTIISEQDQSLIYHPDRKNIAVVPNGIDTQFFTPEPSAAKDMDLVFTGNMNYPPNVEGARRLVLEILPLVRKEFPKVNVLIAGATPSSGVRELEGEGVTVSGWVPDIREAYSRSRIFVAPMRLGSGMQNKLLEAMAMELPCITTALASNAIGATHEQELFIADENEAIAALIISLLAKSEVRNAVGKRARTFVAGKYQWQASMDKLTAIWKK
jgi:sugar transferase (PEP-CTERM/EpsH1 system associated)